MKRKKISMRKIAGESAGLDKKVADDFIKKTLPSLLKDYSPKDIFNADEAALYLETMPERTLHFKGVGCKGTKTRKDRVTMMVCSNMDGSEKPQLLIIGKSAKPRCFKNSNMQNFPVMYESNKNAWMTTTIMEKWLRSWDAKLVKEGRKIVLFLDNCSAHPQKLEDSLTNIKLEFFPPNMTPFLQPMDMGIISNMKFYYRLKMIKFLMEFVGQSNRPKVTLLQAIEWIAEIWLSKVKSETIANCFKKAGFYSAFESLTSENLDGSFYEDVEFLEHDLEYLEHDLENFGIPNEDINTWSDLVSSLGLNYDWNVAINEENDVAISDFPEICPPDAVIIDNDDSGFEENHPPLQIQTALKTIHNELQRFENVPIDVNYSFQKLSDFFSKMY